MKTTVYPKDWQVIDGLRVYHFRFVVKRLVPRFQKLWMTKLYMKIQHMRGKLATESEETCLHDYFVTEAELEAIIFELQALRNQLPQRAKR